MTSEINYIFDLKYLGSGQVTFGDDATGKIIEKEKIEILQTSRTLKM